MGTMYDSRTFVHEASYPSMTEMDHDHDHDRPGDGDGTDRFGETDVSELANYNPTPSSLLAPERTSLDDSEEARSILLQGSSRLELPPTSPQSVIPSLAPELAKLTTDPGASVAPGLAHDIATQLAPALGSATLPPSTPTMAAMIDTRARSIVSSRTKSNPAAAARLKLIAKPDREVTKGPGGRFYCTVEGCTEVPDGFKRRCEWK